MYVPRTFSTRVLEYTYVYYLGTQRRRRVLSIPLVLQYCNIAILQYCNTLDTRRCCGAARCKLHPAGGRQTARSACLQNKKISRRWTTDRTHRCTVCYRQCFLRWRSIAVVATTIYFVLACFAREGLPSASSCPAATAARPPAGGSDGLSWSKVP